MTLLMKSVRRMQPGLVDLLLKHGADVTHVDDRGRTVLMCMGDFSNPELLPKNAGQMGVSVGFAGGTVYPQWELQTASRIVSMLVAHGAKIGAKDKYGSTAMTHTGTQPALAQALLRHGADPNDGLAGAVGYGNAVLLTTLLHKGGDPNTSVKGQGSLLHYSRQFQRPHIISILLKAGAKE